MLAVALLTLAPVAPLPQEIGLASERTRLRFTLERGDADDGGNLDLLGAHYDWLEPFDDLPGLFLGVGGFAGLAGDQGGYLSGGFTAGYRQEVLPEMAVEAGLFVGAAGGGIEDHDGLALRPHVAFERGFGVVGLRLELAALEVDDTDTGGLSLALGLTTASELLIERGGERLEPLDSDGLVERHVRLTPRYLLIDLEDGAQRNNGQPLGDEIDLMGLAADAYVDERWFLSLEGYGAIRGDVDGLRMILAGGGATFPLLDGRVDFEARALAGAAGGGEVDVGGGFLWHARGGVRVALTERVALELMGGWMETPDGSLEGRTLSAGLSLGGNAVGLKLSQPRSSLEDQGLSDFDAELIESRVTVLHKTYVPPGDARREDGGDYEKAIHLVGFGLEQPLARGFAATARVYGAWGGELGGYTEGLLGLRYAMPFPDDERHALFFGAEAGAGGGGGADVGSGLVFHFGAGYRYDLTRDLALELEFGKVEASQGTFEAESFQLGVTWKLNRPWLRD